MTRTEKNLGGRNQGAGSKEIRLVYIDPRIPDDLSHSSSGVSAVSMLQFLGYAGMALSPALSGGTRMVDIVVSAGLEVGGMLISHAAKSKLKKAEQSIRRSMQIPRRTI